VALIHSYSLYFGMFQDYPWAKVFSILLKILIFVVVINSTTIIIDKIPFFDTYDFLGQLVWLGVAAMTLYLLFSHMRPD